MTPVVDSVRTACSLMSSLLLPHVLFCSFDHYCYCYCYMVQDLA